MATLEIEVRKQIFKNHNVLYRGEENNENTSSYTCLLVIKYHSVQRIVKFKDELYNFPYKKKSLPNMFTISVIFKCFVEDNNNRKYSISPLEINVAFNDE